MNPKVVVISGASSGIGLAIATQLQSHGHHVYGLSRTAPKDPFSFQWIAADITKKETLEAALQTILTKESRIDVLINNAGMGISGAIEETTMDAIKRLFDVNLFGLIQLTQLALPALRQSHGIIFNIGSVAGKLTIPFQTFYSMSKSAVHSFSEGLRNELRPLKVRVVAILPGDTRTSFTAHREKNNPSSDLYTKRVERSIQTMEKDEQHGMSPFSVANLIERLMKKGNPPVAVTVGFQYRFLVFLSRLLPSKWVQSIIYQLYGK